MALRSRKALAAGDMISVGVSRLKHPMATALSLSLSLSRRRRLDPRCRLRCRCGVDAAVATLVEAAVLLVVVVVARQSLPKRFCLEPLLGRALVVHRLLDDFLFAAPSRLCHRPESP